MSLVHFHLTPLGAIFIALIFSIIISAGALYWSNLNAAHTVTLLDYMNQSLTQAEESLQNEADFEKIELAHERTTLELKNATKSAGVLLKAMDETQRNIAQLTNDIYIMQKSELESRKTLGKFLAVVAANNNITIPEELRKQLFIDSAEPEQSAPPNY